MVNTVYIYSATGLHLAHKGPFSGQGAAFGFLLVVVVREDRQSTDATLVITQPAAGLCRRHFGFYYLSFISSPPPIDSGTFIYESRLERHVKYFLAYIQNPYVEAQNAYRISRLPS